MKIKLFVIISFLFISLCSIAQTKIYYKNTNTVVATWHNNHLYNGNSIYQSDMLVTLKDGKLYKGNSTYRSDLLMYVGPYGVIYDTNNKTKCTIGRYVCDKGSTYKSDRKATIIGNKIYKGDSQYLSDLLLTTSDKIPNLIIAFLFYY